MPKEYIELEAAIKEMSHMMCECFPEAVEELDAVITTLKEIPAADVVEVVRCSECVHRPTGTGVNHDVHFPSGDFTCPCRCDDSYYSWMPKDNWFCANGKRKDGGQDEYDELVEALRLCVRYGKGADVLANALKAADAIEELSRRETPMKITEIHVDEYYCPACGAENNCDQGYVQDAYCPACGQRLLPEPPKEES